MSEFDEALKERVYEENLNRDGSIGYCIDCYKEGARWAREWVMENWKPAKLVAEKIELRTENQRLRDALEAITSHDEFDDLEWIDFVMDTALEALQGEGDE